MSILLVLRPDSKSVAELFQWIETVEGHIQKCEDALDRIERSLRLEVLTESQRQSLLEDEKQLKKKLKLHEQELGALRKENWKSMVLSVIIFGVVYISYTFFFQS